MPAEALDAAFRRLSQAKGVDMMGDPTRRPSPHRTHRNAVWDGGQDTHLIAIGIKW
jgi:hypothetical protein